MSFMLLSSLATTLLALHFMHPLVRHLDPRRSLASAIGWLVFALSIGLVLISSVWLGDIVRTSLLDQRVRQLDSTAYHFAAELNLDLALRLQSVHALTALLATELRDDNQAIIRRTLENLQQSSPEFEWIGVATPQGRLLATTHGVAEGTSVADRPWFALALKGRKRGDVRLAPMEATTPSGATGREPGSFVQLFASVINPKGDLVGVIGAQLNRRWLLDLAGSLGEKWQGPEGTEALLLDQDGEVLIGPASVKGRRFKNAAESAGKAAPMVAAKVPSVGIEWPSRVEGMTDGSRYLVARSNPTSFDILHTFGWRVVVFQRLQDAKQPAGILQARITLVLLGLGLLAALVGVLLARRITRDLESIARSADAVRTGTTQRIEVPSGRNEAARLGRALDELLTSREHERNALQALNAELDQRVAARTREIERLAEESRYAAVARERLKIARDLHDTLAHSMMAMLSEIRLLKRLSAVDPEALAEEFKCAEEAAQQGLKEARAAIAQMRFNPVRDTGLAAALDDFVKLFVERTGIPVHYESDAQVGVLADQRAEALFRIAEEALRNVERHAGARHVRMSLRAPGNGRGLTLTVADDGAGFDAAAANPGHYGLVGLREQAQLIGASLTIRSAPQQGTTISVTLAPGLDR